MPPFIFAQVQYLKRLVSQIHSTRVVRLLMYFAMAMITLKWNGWQLLNFHKHIIYCLENAFSKITFKRYRLFSGILMINTRKHNKINACNKPDFTTKDLKKGEGSNKKKLGFLIEIHSFNDSYLPVKPSIQNSAEYSKYGKSFFYWCKRHLVKKWNDETMQVS